MIYCESELVEILRNEGRIYIYGAGEVGELLHRRLTYHGLFVSGFCVSDESFVIDKEVVLSKLSGDAYVVIATFGKNKSIFESNLVKNSIVRYEILSDKVITVMRWFDKKSICFQTHITDHCNLNCRGCYHFSSLSKESYVDLAEFERDFARMSYLFNGKAEEIMLLGGEPLLHKRISDLIRIARANFQNAKIKILTNGTLLLNIDNSFFYSLAEESVELWVTKYPIEFDYNGAEQRAKEFGIELNYFNEEPVRTLGHQPLDIKGKKNCKENFYKCYRSSVCTDLKHGKLFPCIIPAEIGPFNSFFNLNIPVTEMDYVDIYECKNAEEVFDKLIRPMPFCRYCDRENIKEFGSIPWSVTRYSIEEWTS